MANAIAWERFQPYFLASSSNCSASASGTLAAITTDFPSGLTGLRPAPLRLPPCCFLAIVHLELIIDIQGLIHRRITNQRLRSREECAVHRRARLGLIA